MGTTLRGFAKKVDLPYSTVRKYLLELEKTGLISLKEGPVGMMIEDEVEEIFFKLIKLMNFGLTLEGALKVLKGEKLPFMENNEDFKKLLLEKSDRIENMLVEIRDLLQNLVELQRECNGNASKEQVKRQGFFSRLFRRKI